MNPTKVDVKFKRDTGQSGRAAPVAVVNLISAAVALSITRPSNITAYEAKDVIGKADSVTPAAAGSAVLKFADITSLGGVLKIVGADLMVHTAAVIAGMANFTLHLYDSEPEAKLDGATWDLTAADRAKYLGSISLGTPVDVGATLFVETNGLAKQVKLAEAGGDLYGVLVTDGAFVPTSGLVFQVRLQVESRS